MKIDKSEIKTVVKYLFSAGTSFIIDLTLFTIFNSICNFSIIVATIISRVLSSLYNYFMNSRYVFSGFSKTSIIKYYTLVVTQMFVSGLSVSLLSNILTVVNSTIIKFFIDLILFIINYFIQTKFIFIKK